MSNGAMPADSSSSAAERGLAPVATAPDAAASAGTGSDPGAGAAPSDYLGRIRSDAEFATQEVRKYQSRATQAEEKLRKMGDLASWADQVGAETVQNAVSRYSTLRQDPHFGRLIQQYETTGQIPRLGGEGLYEEPEPEDPRDVQIRELRQRLEAQEVSGGSQAMRGHVEKFFQDFPMPAEMAEKARAAALETIKKWHQLGPMGVKSIQNLQTPGGYDTVKGLLLSQLTPDEVEQIGLTRRLRTKGTLEEFATDVPSGLSTTGREIPPELKSAAEALKFARRHPDRI